MNYIDKSIPEHEFINLVVTGVRCGPYLVNKGERMEKFCQKMISAIFIRHDEELIKNEYENGYNKLKQDFSNTIELGTAAFMAKNNLIKNYSNNLAVVCMISFDISKKIADLLRAKGYNNGATASHNNVSLGILANRTHYSIYEIAAEQEMEKSFKVFNENDTLFDEILFNQTI